MRKYRSGMTSCIWRWSNVVLYGEPYLRRLHLIRFERGRFGFAVMLHWILRHDPQPDLHDHPTSFLSLVLRGGYLERRASGPYRGRGEGAYQTARWWNLIRAKDRHKIVFVLPGTLTLALSGPKTREWGFHTEQGWIDWRNY